MLELQSGVQLDGFEKQDPTHAHQVKEKESAHRLATIDLLDNQYFRGSFPRYG